MENTTLAYFAGFIDGEGSVTLTKNNKTDKFRHPVVSATNSEKYILDELASLFGGSVSVQKKYKDHHTQCYKWSVSYDQAISMLEQIVPFMKCSEKIRRANHIIDEYKSCTSRNGKYSVTQLSQKLLFEEHFFHPSTPYQTT